MKVAVKDFILQVKEEEGRRLLSEALAWKKEHDKEEKKETKAMYSGKTFEETEIKGVTDDMFPPAIKKLLKGVHDGKKRGLFILITFLRSCGFSPEEIDKRVHEWNEKNEQPLKEGYIRSQLTWHCRQKKKILPPNYDNEAFYKDMGLISEKQKVKNPVVDVVRALRKGKFDGG